MIVYICSILHITKATQKHCCNYQTVENKNKFGKVNKKLSLSKFVLLCSYSTSPVGGALAPSAPLLPASLFRNLLSAYRGPESTFHLF